MFVTPLLWIGVAALTNAAQAQSANCLGGGLCNNGLTGIAGQFNYNTSSYGAQANRQAANDIYKQGLQDYQQGIASMNIPLLAKSFAEAQQY